MALYNVEYITGAGDRLKQRVEAESGQALREQFEAKGCFVIKRTPVLGRKGIGNRPIPIKDIILFVDLLSIQTKAGVTTVTALGKLKDESGFSRATRAVLQSIYADIENSRGNLASSLAKFPKAFPSDLVTTVRIGEDGGGPALAARLRDIQETLSFRMEMKGEITTALLYPAACVLSLIGLLGVVFIYLIPKIELLVRDANTRAPGEIERLEAISHFCTHQYGWIIAGLVAPFVAYALLMRVPGFAFAVDKLRLSLPILGRVIRSFAVAAVAKNFRAMYLAAVQPGPSFQACAEASTNRVICAALLRAKVLIAEGIIGQQNPNKPPITEALRTTGFVPPLALTILTTGETTGTFPDSLQHVSEIYLKQARSNVRLMLKVFSIAVFILTAAFVGYVVLTVYDTINAVSSSI